MNELTQGGAERKKCKKQGWEAGKGAWKGVGTNHWKSGEASVTAIKRVKNVNIQMLESCNKKTGKALWVC